MTERRGDETDQEADVAEVARRAKTGDADVVRQAETGDAGDGPAVRPCGSAAWTDEERAAMRLWIDIVRVAETIRARLVTGVTGISGLTPEEVELLVRLSEAPEQRLRMVDVSRSLVLSKSGVTRMIDRLAQRGLVERALCPTDRRVVYAGLTDEGRRELEEAAPLLRAGVVEHLGRHLRPHERDAVGAALHRVLEAEGAEP